ncbi:MAG: hypothetical protein R3236_04065 [Phycisphaeraceae bacterium]|nr:hypothetical protein [Phycisphaeraceae bacterium]
MIRVKPTQTALWMAAGMLWATFAATAHAGDPVRRALDLRVGHKGMEVRFKIVDGRRVRSEVRVSSHRSAHRPQKPRCTTDRCVHTKGRAACESTVCRTARRHGSRTVDIRHDRHTRHHGHGHGHGKKAAAFDGWRWLNRGRYLHAVGAFERSLDRHPHRASDLAGLAIGQLALGDRSSAAAVMRRAVVYDTDVLACEPLAGVDRALIGRLLHTLEHAAARCRTGEVRFLQAALNAVKGRYRLSHRQAHLARAAGDRSVAVRRLQGWLHRKLHPPVHRRTFAGHHRPVHHHAPHRVFHHHGRRQVDVGHRVCRGVVAGHTGAGHRPFRHAEYRPERH